MKVLFVTPVEVGSGETITTLHMAENIVRDGGKVLFLASTFASSFIKKQFPCECNELMDDGTRNREIWDSAISTFQPDVVVFADYPLLFFKSGVSPILNMDEWVKSLEELDICLVTLDHTGFAQRSQGLFFGPPHLSFNYEKIPAIPERMHILLPCPMHEPTGSGELKGYPFRYWEVPLKVGKKQRQKIRRHYLGNEDNYMIFHSAARWAWETAESFGIPYYQFLPKILEYYFSDMPKPVTIVSVNNSELLKQSNVSNLRFINVKNLPKNEYEELLFSSDLMLTENKISITLGKVICSTLLPCVVLKNSYRFRELLGWIENGELRQIVKTLENIRAGSVYPYDIFPGGMKDEIQQLGLYQENSITKGFKELEIYGGEETRYALRALLTEQAERDAVRAHQNTYVENLKNLEDAKGILKRVIETNRSDR